MKFTIPPPTAQVVDRFAIYDYSALPDAATALAHAYGEVTGALCDFRAAIYRAQTAGDLRNINSLLRELTAMCVETEKQALDRADSVNGGTAA